MPRKITGDQEMPRRRRRAAAEAERGLAMRILLHSPKDTVAAAFAFAASLAIVTNALFLQRGPHPAPMFGSNMLSSALMAPSPLPRPRPAEADASPEPQLAEPRQAEPRQAEPRPSELKAPDPLANLVKTTTAALPSSNVIRPPTPIPLPALQSPRRIAAVQRALTEYGYGQLKPTGTMGPDTQAAIQKFERARKMPVTGQVSDRLVRELDTMIGHPID